MTYQEYKINYHKLTKTQRNSNKEHRDAYQAELAAQELQEFKIELKAIKERILG